MSTVLKLNIHFWPSPHPSFSLMFSINNPVEWHKRQVVSTCAYYEWRAPSTIHHTMTVQWLSKHRYLHHSKVHTYIHFFIIVGCNEADLADQGRTLNPARCADRGFVNTSSISGGVLCYNGTTTGSRAVYICNDGFILVGNEVRVCQSDGNWNGSIPWCFSEESGMYSIHASSTSELI